MGLGLGRFCLVYLDSLDSLPKKSPREKLEKKGWKTVQTVQTWMGGTAGPPVNTGVEGLDSWSQTIQTQPWRGIWVFENKKNAAKPRKKRKPIMKLCSHIDAENHSEIVWK